MSDRFKTDDAAYAAQSTALIPYLRAHKARLGLTDAQIDGVADDVTPFPLALADSDDADRQKKIKTALKEATNKSSRRELGRFMDNLGDRWTNDDRIENGMPPLSDERHKRLAPTQTPMLVLDYDRAGALTVLVLDRDNPHIKGKPDDVDACELHWDARDADFLPDPDEWHSGPTPSDLRSPIPLKLKPTFKGKSIAVAGRYRNTGGEGPWSEIVEKPFL